MSMNNVACLNSNRIRLKYAFLQAYFYCMISPIEFNTITCCNQVEYEEHSTILCRVPCTNKMDHQLIFCLFQKAFKTAGSAYFLFLFSSLSAAEKQAADGSLY